MEIQSDAGTARAPTGAPILSASDAERLVEGLKRHTGDSWMRQHGLIEKLNLQAHYNASTNSDPFVLEALITFDKLGTLVHELVAIEAWRERAFPLVKDRVAQKNSMRVYYVLYHEAVLFNLLEVLLFHQHCAEAIDEEMIELVDVCARKMTLLNARDPAVTPTVFDSAKERFEVEDGQTTAQQLRGHLTSLGFRACVSAVVAARYIAEHIKHLSVSVMARVLDTHDYMIQFVALLENPPWVRRTSKGAWQKFYDLKWHDVAPRDLLLVTRNEGQVWIGLYNLMCEPECQKRYHFNSWRKDAVLRVRKYLNDVLVDQIPVLQHVQRYMDELAIMEAPEPTAMKGLVVEQVPKIRDGILKGTDWAALADEQVATLFGEGAQLDNADLIELAELYTSDAYEGAE